MFISSALEELRMIQLCCGETIGVLHSHLLAAHHKMRASALVLHYHYIIRVIGAVQVCSGKTRVSSQRNPVPSTIIGKDVQNLAMKNVLFISRKLQTA